MVESGDIDWANHANNFAGMIGTVWSLDEAATAQVIPAANSPTIPAATPTNW